MPGKTRYATDATLNLWLRNTAQAAVATPYVGLFSTAPADDNSAGTELTGNGYARQAVTFAAPATDTGNIRKCSNSGALTFGPASPADWLAALAWGVFDALTTGNMLYWDYLLGPRIAFVADATADTLTAASHGLVNGNRVQMQNTGGVLPTGLAVLTTYFVVGATTNTLQLSATSGGSAIDITAIGNGLNVVALDYTKTVLNGDFAQFAASQLVIKED